MKRKKNHDQNPTSESGSQHKVSSPPEIQDKHQNLEHMECVEGLLSPTTVVPQPQRHPKCPLCLDEMGSVGDVLCCRATAARDLTAHGQPWKSNSRYLLPGFSCQARAGTMPDAFLPLAELRGAKHEEQPCPQQGNTHTQIGSSGARSAHTAPEIWV